jgi:hypothetical protein
MIFWAKRSEVKNLLLISHFIRLAMINNTILVFKTEKIFTSFICRKLPSRNPAPQQRVD